jgi:chromosome segregation ATPase
MRKRARSSQSACFSVSDDDKQNIHIQVQSFNSQKLEDALVILNQKSEEIEGLESHLAGKEAQIEHLQAEHHRIQVECEQLSVTQTVQREALEEAKGTVSELGVHIDWLQDSLDKSQAKVKQLQGETDEIRDALNTKVEEHNLARAEWEQERAVLEARIASLGDGASQQPPAGWELEKNELEDRLVEVREERDQLDKEKRYAENEVETWKEQSRKEFVHSQGLRQVAKDAKTESCRIQEEKSIIASQTTEAVRLVTVKYEAVVEKLKTELAKAESLNKVLQAKDEQTGDDVRRRAASATHLQEEVRRLHEELASDMSKKTLHTAELEGGKPLFLVNSSSIKMSTEARYRCHFPVSGVQCGQGFDTLQVL